MPSEMEGFLYDLRKRTSEWRSQLYLSRICLPCSYFFRRGKSSSSPKTPVEKGYIVHGFRLLFGKYLYITNTVASAALMSLADFFQQEVENISAGKQKYSFDWTRNIHMTEVGAVQGCLSHFFYMLLDKHMPGTQISTIVKKLVIDQGFFSPLCISLFFLGMQYLSANSWESSVNELREKFLLVYLVDCIVWIPTQFVNFYLLPPRFRVLYLSVISVLYNMFLSFIKHNTIKY